MLKARDSVIISVLILIQSPTGARWPGRIGSMWPISVARRRSGARTTVSSSRLTASVISSPPTRTTSSLTLMGLETVAGLAIRTNTASPKTIALTVKTLHRIETEAGLRCATGWPCARVDVA